MLKSLYLKNFRSFNFLSLETTSLLNIVCGSTSSGKSSLLDSVFFSCRGKSSFLIPTRNLITIGSNFLSVDSLFCSGDNFKIFISDHDDFSLTHFDKKITSFARTALQPIIYLDKSCFDLLSCSINFRRKLFFWVLFYFSSDFPGLWKQYMYCYRSRSELLKLNSFDRELIFSWNFLIADILITFEKIFFNFKNELFSLLNLFHDCFPFSLESLNLIFNMGFSNTYYDTLHFSPFFLDSSYLYNIKREGMHLCSFKFLHGNTDASFYYSKFQSELISLIIIYIFCIILSKKNYTPILVFDDISFEVFTAFFNIINTSMYKNSSIQFWVSVLNNQTDFRLFHNFQMFHVEHLRSRS